MTQRSSTETTGLLRDFHEAIGPDSTQTPTIASQRILGQNERLNKSTGMEGKTIEQRRRSKVDGLRREAMTLQASLAHKEPWTFTHEEKLEVSLLRMRLNDQLRMFNSKKKAAYLDQLISEVRAIREGLTKRTEYKNEATREKEERMSGAERFRRYRTRQKAKKYGINVPTKRGRKPISDNAPPLIKAQRSRMTQSSIRRKMAKLESETEGGATSDPTVKSVTNEPVDLLQVGWRHKKMRS